MLRTSHSTLLSKHLITKIHQLETEEPPLDSSFITLMTITCIYTVEQGATLEIIPIDRPLPRSHHQQTSSFKDKKGHTFTLHSSVQQTLLHTRYKLQHLPRSIGNCEALLQDSSGPAFYDRPTPWHEEALKNGSPRTLSAVPAPHRPETFLDMASSKAQQLDLCQDEAQFLTRK
ncbi:hypothetical protein L7F22_027951 [Adiantum nelumboides]|nr:hypothetical protein [Adiantum nelumboides]